MRQGWVRNGGQRNPSHRRCQGWERRAEEFQAFPHTRSNSGPSSSWHRAKITHHPQLTSTLSSHHLQSLSRRLSHLRRQSPDQQTIIVTSQQSGERGSGWREQKWGDLKRCAECQEFYFRYLVMFRSPSPCKSKNPKPTFNAGYFRFTANYRGLFHPLPTNALPVILSDHRITVSASVCL